VKASALCSVTHSLITSGSCPWCSLTISAETTASLNPSWDFAVIRSVLLHGTDSSREVALANVSRGDGMTIEDQVELLSLILRNNEVQSRRFGEQVLLLAGSKMSKDDASRLEHRLARASDGLALRIPLLAYYSIDRSVPTSKTRRLEIALWLIENEPDSFTSGSPFARILRRTDPAGYELVKSAWLRQTSVVEPTVASLRNAAAFFAPNDVDESERLHTQANSLEH